MSKKAILEACEKAGGQVALTKFLGVRQGNISHWMKVGLVPSRHVLKIERKTGVSRHDLNHTIYPRE
jgi:DNA-binding transcriptional regulator YdaS (Cro superfamily)